MTSNPAYLAAIGLALIAPLGHAPVSHAQERQLSYDTYGDWRASVMQIDSAEESWRECTAITGGDGLPSLRVAFRQYDAGPPDFFPPVEIFESAPRGYATQMQQGGRVDFTFDDGERYTATAINAIAEDVFQTASASPAQNHTLNVLRGMRRASRLDITHQGRIVLSASLKGFTAAYGKIAEACGFSTIGVIEPLAQNTQTQPSQTQTKQEQTPSGDAGDTGVLLFEQFDVWRAQAQEHDNDGSIVLECFASIPTDTDRRLTFGWNSLEIPPPESFPPLMLSEAIPDSRPAMTAPDARIRFAFDTGLVVPGEVLTYISQDGTRFIDLMVTNGYRDIALRELNRASTLRVMADSSVIYQTPVSGFGDAYAAIGKTCDFTTAGVLD